MNQQLRRRPIKPELGGSNSFGLLQSFIDRAQTRPQSCAVIAEGCSWTYAEIADRARIIARCILDAMPAKPDRIGILGDRTVPSYIGILASLMAGAAFVPINRKHPASLRRQIIESADLDAIIVTNDCVTELGGTLDGLQTVPLPVFPDTVRDAAADWPEIDAGAIAASKSLAAYPLVRESDTAYLLFTSGSTGSPKGVPISHGNICSFLASIQERYQLHAGDRFTQNFELSFDLALFDLFAAWQCGGAVCVPSAAEKLRPFDFARRNHVTVWFSVPSQAMQLMNRGLLSAASMPTLRLSLFCGEPLSSTLAEAWQKAAPASIVENLYGPTELTVACLAYRWRDAESPAQCYRELVPIGLPFRGLETIVVDGEDEDVADSEIGELCVAGPQTFAGYWRGEPAPSDVFLARRKADGTTLRYYRTGDLVAKRQNVFVFCGRNDDQIKINGYRIELGQIEGEMRAAGLGETIALAWPDATAPQSILLVLRRGADAARALSEAASRLPAYMVPAHIALLDEFPTNLNGKTDRAAARRMVEDIMAVSRENPVRGTLSELDSIIAEALEIAPGTFDDKLSLNSISNWDSLGHARLMMALEALTGEEIPGATIAQLNSVEAIRRYVAKTLPGDVAARPHEADEPVHRGLAGLFVERSAISRVDGEAGTLEYGGYNIDELCARCSFEEVFWLLLRGELPSQAELRRFIAQLASYRVLPPQLCELLLTMRQAAPSAALRTAISALSASPDFAVEPLETGLRITALIPVIIATHDAMRRNAPVPLADPALPHAANFARMLLGSRASSRAVEFMERDLILHADHEANASTFTTRIAIGCGADLIGAVTAAISAFMGELHGGAVEAAARMFDEIGEPARAADYVRDRKRIMGFGHRVYQVEDPRVRHMRSAAASLAETFGDLASLRIADALVDAMRPRAKFGIAPNIDLYASVAYRSLGIPDDLGTALGAAGRVGGWVAHALEQRRDSILVRPRFQYVGPPSRKYPGRTED